MADLRSSGLSYQDLLKNAHDEELFEHYLQARIVRVDLDGKVEPIGRAGILWSFNASPDGRYLLVEMLHRPFSYLVPARRFPRRVEVWDRGGEVVRQLADLPLQEEVPIAFGSVPTGPRSFGWRSDAPATIHCSRRSATTSRWSRRRKTNSPSASTNPSATSTKRTCGAPIAVRAEP